MTEMMLNGEIVEIDDLCVPFITFFNRNGMKTEFWCQGHTPKQDFYIIFDRSVTNRKMLEFNKKYWSAFDSFFPFNKWLRIAIKNGCEFESYEEYERVMDSPFDEKYEEIMCNWRFTIAPGLFNDDIDKMELLNELYTKLIRIENQT